MATGAAGTHGKKQLRVLNPSIDCLVAWTASEHPTTRAQYADPMMGEYSPAGYQVADFAEDENTSVVHASALDSALKHLASYAGVNLQQRPELKGKPLFQLAP